MENYLAFLGRFRIYTEAITFPGNYVLDSYRAYN